MGVKPHWLRLGHLAYVAGHRLLIAACLSILLALFALLVTSGGASRFPVVRLWVAKPGAPIVMTALASFAFLGPLFYPMFARQWWPYPTGNLLAAWLAFVGLSLVPRIERRWPRLRLLSILALLGVIAANHFGLHRVLPEIHTAMTVIEIALMALIIRRRSATSASKAWVRSVAWAIVFAAAAASVAIQPRFLVAAELAKDDTSSVFLLLTPLYRTPNPSREDLVLAADARWFEHRDATATVPPSEPRLPLAHPKVILFTIDSLRYEVFADKRAVVMPHLDALAKESSVFSRAHSTATATAPSLSSIVTGHFYSQGRWVAGAYPSRHIFFPGPQAQEAPTIATLLGPKHVATFWAPPMQRLNQSWGIVRGFEEEAPTTSQHRPGQELAADVIAWMSRHPNDSAFAFTHLLEPHIPYEGAGTTPYERYLGDVTTADAILGDFIAKLREKGLWNQTILIVSADHGEAFGEHDQINHGGYVYEDEVHVPLVIRVPGIPGHRVDEPVSLIDLGPTVLDIFGVDVPGDFQGQSLLPWLRGGRLSRSAPIAFDTPSNGISPNRKSRGLLFRDGIKAMWSAEDWRFELYDLERDPWERENLADDRADAMKRLGLLVTFFATHGLE